jgi:outer membrane protein assembly factor BamB
MLARALAFALLLVPGVSRALTLRPFTPPARTTWKPEGCRVVPKDDPVLGERAYYRNLHADAWNSAEVSIALAPVLEYAWTAETDKWTPTGPSFDRAGNLYISPFWPGEEVILVSLDPRDGSRRWAIPGAGPSGCAPFVADDPDHPGEQIVYVARYEEAIAVRTDGTIVWRKPSGLVAGGPVADDPGAYTVFGINYDPVGDVLVADTGDGHLYALDRRTGNQVLAAPFTLPGAKSPPATIAPIPPSLLAMIDAELHPLFAGAPPTLGFESLVQVLLGGGTKVANFFSIDPWTGRLWIAATAPDGEDGTVDGISEYGALYGLDLDTTGGPPHALVEACHTYFQGGSASTPALRPDGTRIYVGDATTHLIAYDRSCTEIWRLDVGGQINGAIGVSSDGGELYVSQTTKLLKVIDRGDAGEIVWEAAYDMYVPGPGETFVNFHLLLPAIGANGLLAEAGAGLLTAAGTPIPLRLGIAHVDRETGMLRSFAEGPEESVSVTAVGPDGAVYLANSPIRRAIARALFPATTAPLVGGVGKYAPRRNDLLARDAACAGYDRIRNARRHRRECPDAAIADLRQVLDLAAEARRAAALAETDGDLSGRTHARVDGLLGHIVRSRAVRLHPAQRALRSACRLLDD